MEKEQLKERYMHPRELVGSFRSKEDIYKWFTEHEQMVLPPMKECRMSKYLFVRNHSHPPSGFLKQLFAGEKRTIKLEDVTRLKVPKYKEVSSTSLTIAISGEPLPNCKLNFLTNTAQDGP